MLLLAANDPDLSLADVAERKAHSGRESGVICVRPCILMCRVHAIVDLFLSRWAGPTECHWGLSTTLM